MLISPSRVANVCPRVLVHIVRSYMKVDKTFWSYSIHEVLIYLWLNFHTYRMEDMEKKKQTVEEERKKVEAKETMS